MPKYYDYKICGYYLYYTSHCIIEAMHVHASDRSLSESGSAKFFVKSNGDTTVEKRGRLSDLEIRLIREFINPNYSQPPHSMSQSIHSQARVCRRYAAHDCDCVVGEFHSPGE